MGEICIISGCWVMFSGYEPGGAILIAVLCPVLDTWRLLSGDTCDPSDFRGQTLSRSIPEVRKHIAILRGLCWAAVKALNLSYHNMDVYQIVQPYGF